MAHNTEALPDDLAAAVLAALKSDAKFGLGDVLRATELTPEQVATHAAALAHSHAWHDRMELRTRDRIVHICRQRFTPPEPAAPDPLAQAADRSGEFDPWRRHADLHAPEHTVVIGGDPKITDTREGQS